ncbi:DUF2759 family protein [Cronbergia sp. UHCC 0137]|uniref:DUF2759 family protein n=1 Tax=Cronbergia sp. UHCC 0137 TaxID=3110239 RepID=UPI002B211B93|nr:DUF2759 family protein [Cronbergia sp. UHCC 0137]MEA5616504.1 DUF2759 family protein [Cronbergia sp. UHCC 0137]
MLEDLQITNIFAIGLVVVSISLLGYFSVKTLITSNSFQQGIKLYQAKDYQGAEAAFRKVIAINSTNDVVRLLLGDLLNNQGKTDEAKELFTQVINRSPKNADAYLRLANILLLQEKQEEALKNLEQSKALFQKQRQPEKAQTIAKIIQQVTTKTK